MGAQCSSWSQALPWDRGRPARNEREARKESIGSPSTFGKLRASGAFAGGTPAVPGKSWRGDHHRARFVSGINQRTLGEGLRCFVRVREFE